MLDHMPSKDSAVKALIATLRDAGVDPHVILTAVEALLDVTVTRDITDDITKRSRHAEAQSRYRLRKNGGDITRDHPVTPPAPARVVSSTSTTEIPGKKERKKDPTEAEFRAELETVLDPEQAAAVVEHRQRGKSPMKTLRAARALAGKFAKCPDRSAAVETMLARSWLSVEPEWLEPKRPNGPGPPPKPLNMSSKVVDILKKPLEETYGRSRSEEPPNPALCAIRDG
jgi:hypothetical protein